MPDPSPRPMPRQPAPDLTVELAGGGSWRLRTQSPEAFTLLVFYRGLHCPICKKYLNVLEAMQGDFAERGVEVIAISMDDAVRARKTLQDWDVGELPVGYGLSEAQARAWGLYLSEGVKEGEPALFSEPGLFLVRPDGTLYLGVINTAPFGRPRLDSLLGRIDYILENDYPARGEVPAEAVAA